MKRHDGRKANQLRTLKIAYNIFEYTPGSVLIELGKTKVLCAITLQSSVPAFLRGQGTGWLTAEYALLPASTSTRTNREISVMRRHHRSVEISRLISRSLRAVIDFSCFGERTIIIDCDVLQADGGTRTASIIGAYAALIMAQKQWRAEGIITKDIIKQDIAAVSVGILADGSLALDPDYQEDSTGKADINFIMTHTGEVVEAQGGAEQEPISWEQFIKAGQLAQEGIAQIGTFLKNNTFGSNTQKEKERKTSLFSLQGRQPQGTASS